MKLLLFKEVSVFIDKLQKPTRSKWISQLELLNKYGEHLSMPHSRRINKVLWELRIREKQEARAFYTIYRNQIIILHVFVKKTQKTPNREIETAMKRRTILTNI